MVLIWAMGFGQRVFHTEDPRARIIKNTVQKLVETGYAKRDAFYDIAQEIEERAMSGLPGQIVVAFV